MGSPSSWDPLGVSSPNLAPKGHRLFPLPLLPSPFQRGHSSRSYLIFFNLGALPLREEGSDWKRLSLPGLEPASGSPRPSHAPVAHLCETTLWTGSPRSVALLSMILLLRAPPPPPPASRVMEYGVSEGEGG